MEPSKPIKVSCEFYDALSENGVDGLYKAGSRELNEARTTQLASCRSGSRLDYCLVTVMI